MQYYELKPADWLSLSPPPSLSLWEELYLGGKESDIRSDIWRDIESDTGIDFGSDIEGYRECY